jgi:protein TonB
MYANGFLEQKRRSPAGLVGVIAVHGAGLAALIAFGTTTFVRQKDHNPIVINVPRPHEPPPVPPPPPSPRDPTTPQQVDQVTAPPTDLHLPAPFAAQPTPPTDYHPPLPPGPQLALNTATPTLPPPVRRAAQVDPNYRDALQPPYPREMETAGRNGSVQVRITIGTDGRVSAIEQLTATDASFWRVTERQARSRWRFRPATVDGRPVVSTMVMTVTFRIPDEA